MIQTPVNSFMDRLQKAVLSEMESGNLSLLCGAGLSSSPPSNLPLAKKLVSEVQKNLLGSFESFVGQTDLRPEVIFKLMSTHAVELLQSFLKDLLDNVNFNKGHLFAAKCLALQNPVVTTNFDQLIESACVAEKVSFLRNPPHKLDSPSAPTLLKIHGTIDAISTLMLTIDHVFKGPDKKMVSLVGSILEGRTLLVLGYSGLDQLDIMPLLEKINTKKIIWFSHVPNCEGWSKSQASNNLIGSLPKLEHFSGNTNDFISPFVNRSLGSSRENSTKRHYKILPKKIRGRIVADILMHQNRYAEILDFIRATGLGRYIEFRINRLEALGGLGKRDGRYWRLRSSLWDSIVVLPPQQCLLFVASLAKFAKNDEERKIAIDLVERAYGTPDPIPIGVIEASLELAYDFGLNGDQLLAEYYLNKAQEAAEIAGEILLSARSSIIKSALMIVEYINYPTSKIATNIITEAERAMELLDSQIVHDKYFYCQARNNRATGRRFIKDYKGAIDDYEKNLIFFKSHSVNHTIQTFYNMSFAFIGLAQGYNARKVLLKAKQLNLENNRSFMLDKIEEELSSL